MQQKQRRYAPTTWPDSVEYAYTRHPFYGSRRMVVFLKRVGHNVNRKKVQVLMREMGIAGMAPSPNTSRPHPEHKVYPYLLRGVLIVRPNQVWSTDITYIRLARGFAYLAAVIDWYSRRVLSWRISNTMEAEFCVDCLEEALHRHDKPEIFNSDQGSQFTSDAFTGVLKREDIANSMDGRGRAFDNIFVERLWRNVKLLLVAFLYNISAIRLFEDNRISSSKLLLPTKRKGNFFDFIPKVVTGCVKLLFFGDFKMRFFPVKMTTIN